LLVSIFPDDRRETLKSTKHTDHDQPLGLLNTVLVLLRISQRCNIDAFSLLDLICGPVSDENWLASPFDDDLL
jgi:hypothetical protein